MSIKKLLFIFFTFIALFIFSISCGNDDATTPSISFGKYVAIGNSLTAGISNNGLYNESIRNAYPNLLAQKLQEVGGGVFSQAYFAEEERNGTGYLKIDGYNGFVPNLSTVNTNLALKGNGLTSFVGVTQNLGIPGIKMSDVDSPIYSQSNIFFKRILGNAAAKSYLTLIEEAKPTFFSCWLGSNDLLAYANSGGNSAITSTAIFKGNLTKVLEALTKNGAKGVVANIPDISTIPAINIINTYRPLLTSNKFYVTTKAGVREGTSADFLLIPNNFNALNLNTFTTKGITIQQPWADNEVLDANEMAELKAKTLEFNALIELAAKDKGLAFYNAYANSQAVAGTFTENGDSVDAVFLGASSAFSIDGTHLTPKGNAFTANQFIKAINATYKTNIQLLNTKGYKGN